MGARRSASAMGTHLIATGSAARGDGAGSGPHLRRFGSADDGGPAGVTGVHATVTVPLQAQADDSTCRARHRLCQPSERSPMPLRATAACSVLRDSFAHEPNGRAPVAQPRAVPGPCPRWYATRSPSTSVEVSSPGTCGCGDFLTWWSPGPGAAGRCRRPSVLAARHPVVDEPEQRQPRHTPEQPPAPVAVIHDSRTATSGGSSTSSPSSRAGPRHPAGCSSWAGSRSGPVDGTGRRRGPR